MKYQMINQWMTRYNDLNFTIMCWFNYALNFVTEVSFFECQQKSNLLKLLFRIICTHSVFFICWICLTQATIKYIFCISTSYYSYGDNKSKDHYILISMVMYILRYTIRLVARPKILDLIYQIQISYYYFGPAINVV